jgi:hypothetical protein
MAFFCRISDLNSYILSSKRIFISNINNDVYFQISEIRLFCGNLFHHKNLELFNIDFEVSSYSSKIRKS